MNIWESSVKASHNFLKPDDFAFYKKIIPVKYLPALKLYILQAYGKSVGFIGVSSETLEMLFISANSIGQGYGKTLLNFAIQELNISKTDVNEQNKRAKDFYTKFGFKIVGRSEKDGMNKDYPVLHLSL